MSRSLLASARVCLSFAVVSLLGASPLAAQQSVPFRNGIPVAPTGLEIPPLPEAPVFYKTAEGQEIRVVVYARGLNRPWSIAFLPDGAMLVTERVGRLRVIRDGQLDPEPVEGLPEIRVAGLAGLMDLALHPRFDENRYVYFSYVKPQGESGALAVARGAWDGRALTNVQDVFTTTDVASVSRIAFGPDGMLYVTTAGGNGEDAQNPQSLAGKVLRLTDEGGVPPDNPFVRRRGYKPEIFTLGHRSTLGLAVHPVTGELWQNENGPNGGDEINVLKPGANYGWPLVSLGRTYAGEWQSQGFSRRGFEDPLVYWTPSIAVSGMTFYTGEKLGHWRGDVFVGGLRMGEIPGTGHVQRILFNENFEELRREMLLTGLRQRIRDVRQGPDELLYLLTDEEDGAILRIEPADMPLEAAAVGDWIEVPLPPGVFQEGEGGYRTDTIDIPLGPYGELEYKLGLREGGSIVYRWEAQGLEDPSLLYAEFHGHTERIGDAPGTLMFYRKASGASESGSLVAPFTGIHGWYLQNQSDAPIVVRLHVSGFYELVDQ